jgi:hypothetical protein
MSDQPRPPSDTDEFVWSPDQMIARLGGDDELALQRVTLFIGECPWMLAQLRAFEAAFAQRASAPRAE